MNSCVWCGKLTRSHLLGRYRREDYYLCHTCYTTLKLETINKMEDHIKKKNIEDTLALLKDMSKEGFYVRPP